MNRSTQLEEYLTNECSFDLVKNPDNIHEVDRSTTPVPIVELFYRFGTGNYPQNLTEYIKPLTQDKFAKEVYEFCRENSNNNSFRKETKDAWFQRIKKAWASIIRDVHFAFMMFEYQDKNQAFDNVYFSIKKDIEEGADLVIEDKGITYHINLFINSRKSRQFFDKKKKERQSKKTAIDIEVPMNFGGPKKELQNKGDNIWLYTREHVESINELINTNDCYAITDKYGKTISKISKYSIEKVPQ